MDPRAPSPQCPVLLEAVTTPCGQNSYSTKQRGLSARQCTGEALGVPRRQAPGRLRKTELSRHPGSFQAEEEGDEGRSRVGPSASVARSLWGRWTVRARVGVDVGVNKEPLKISSRSVPERGEAGGPGRRKSVLGRRLCSAQGRVFLVPFSSPLWWSWKRLTGFFCVPVYLKGTLSSFEHKERIP